jgi:hypothetical protein
MSFQRLPYDEAATAPQMSADCRAVEENLHLPAPRTRAERTARAAGRPAPSIRYEDYPREVAKPTIEISDAASRLAAAIHPYMD